jgi:hypothetical protein
VHRDEAANVAAATGAAYAKQYGRLPGIFLTAPAAGGRVFEF